MYPINFYLFSNASDRVSIRQFLILGSKAHKVFQFVKITKIRKRDVAQKIFDQNPSLDLQSAIGLFYQLKFDDRYREDFKTEDEFYEEEQGKSSLSESGLQ